MINDVGIRLDLTYQFARQGGMIEFILAIIFFDSTRVWDGDDLLFSQHLSFL